MQIAKLNSGQQQTLPIFGSRGEQAGNSIADIFAAPGSGSKDAVGIAASDYRQILANYDVADISPREFSQMIHELHTSGAINDTELQELTSIRMELDRAELEPDEKLNLLQLFAERMEQQSQSAKDVALGREESELSVDSQQQAIAISQRRLEWLQKFATLHAESANAALNAYA